MRNVRICDLFCFLIEFVIELQIAVICVCKRKYQCYMQLISQNVIDIIMSSDNYQATC